MSAIKTDMGEYAIGGCGVAVTQISNKQLEVILFSAGEDELESLNHVAESLYESLIMNDSNVEVSWKELPII